MHCVNPELNVWIDCRRQIAFEEQISRTDYLFWELGRMKGKANELAKRISKAQGIRMTGSEMNKEVCVSQLTLKNKS